MTRNQNAHKNEEDFLQKSRATHDTALLFFTLQTPGPIPRYVFDRLGDEAERAITELLLSVYLGKDVDERAKGSPLIPLDKLRQRFKSETSVTHGSRGQHWSFHRLRR